MPREVPLERVVAVQHRHARAMHENALQKLARYETDSPYFRMLKQAKRRERQHEVDASPRFDDADARISPRTNGVVAPRPPPELGARVRSEVAHALILPTLSPRGRASGVGGGGSEVSPRALEKALEVAAAKTVQHDGRIPTDLCGLVELLHKIIGVTARAADIADPLTSTTDEGQNLVLQKIRFGERRRSEGVATA